MAVWSGAFWVEAARVTATFAEWLLQFDEDDARLLSVMVLSTLFTSVWVWLYAGAGLLLRALRPALAGLDRLRRHLDTEGRPVHTMGLLVAVLASVGFVISAPLVL
jgi:hypothetical protein